MNPQIVGFYTAIYNVKDITQAKAWYADILDQ